MHFPALLTAFATSSVTGLEAVTKETLVCTAQENGGSSAVQKRSRKRRENSCTPSWWSYVDHSLGGFDPVNIPETAELIAIKEDFSDGLCDEELQGGTATSCSPSAPHRNPSRSRSKLRSEEKAISYFEEGIEKQAARNLIRRNKVQPPTIALGRNRCWRRKRTKDRMWRMRVTSHPSTKSR